MNARTPSFLIVLGSGLALAGCPSDPVAPADSGAVDTGGALDAPRDAPPRADAPAGRDALDAARAATASFVPVACNCIGMRGMVTAAECIANSAPDAPYQACERTAFNTVRDAFTAYFNCLAESTAAREACYAGSDCSATATEACDATADAANDACLALITDAAARTTFVDTNNRCIADTIIGPSTGSCLESGAAISAVGPSVFRGTTVLGGDHTNPTPSCVGFQLANADGSPDRAHRWRAPSAGVYRFDTIGADFDTVLYIRLPSTNCATTQLGCNDDIEQGVNVDSEVEVTLAADQEIQVIVDGFGETARGNYVVNITYVGMADAGPGGPDAGPIDAGVAADAGMDASTDPDAGVGDDAGPPAVEVLSCAGLTPAATIATPTASAYTPSTATVDAGDVVRFDPMGMSHNMVSGTPGTPDGLFSTTVGAEACLRFNVAGTYPFFCGPHLFTGSITVN